ncbi:hypothetical protein CBS101457_001540 [Exobasidium rhododendri]|nr:hypothetical protein CBS101457_001540 [Exobasidium rhododendri]
MTSRVRKDRGPPAESEEQQLWQSVRTDLNALHKFEISSEQNLSGLENARRKYIEEHNKDEDGSVNIDEATRAALIVAYRRLDKAYEEELKEIYIASEKLELLVAVRDDPDAEVLSKRKKRHTDAPFFGANSISPPLQSVSVKERNITPTVTREESSNTSSSLLPPVLDKEKKRSNSKSNVVAGNAAPTLQRRSTLTSKDPQATAFSNAVASNTSSSSIKDTAKDNLVAALNTSSSYIDPARARREVLAAQLPLQRGRKVAFRQPSKNKVGPGAANVSNMTSRSATSANAASSIPPTSLSSQGVTIQSGLAVPDDEGETWIMATITDCINNDRNRYVVQDAEDTVMPTYNTTLKAIVPLPESLSTLPLDDYKVGTQVMGLYPDTSCFYQAIVRGGGPGVTGKITAKMQRRADEILNTPYRLEFEDDGGAIQNVPACLVVERP